MNRMKIGMMFVFLICISMFTTKVQAVDLFTTADGIVFDKDTNTILSYTGTTAELVIPAQIEGIDVEHIGEGAFASKSLTSVVLPDTITSIADNAFMWNEITSINLPEGITSIGNLAFDTNQITSVTLPSSLLTIGERAFYQNQLTEIEVPESVTLIGRYAFNDNQIGYVKVKYAFAGLYDFKITFGTSVTWYEEAELTNEISVESVSDGSILKEYFANYHTERQEGISSSGTALVSVNEEFSLDLSTIFMDRNNQVLTYTLAIDGAEAVPVDCNFSYTPLVEGSTVLYFEATDGFAHSTIGYQLTLTAESAPTVTSVPTTTTTSVVSVENSLPTRIVTIPEQEAKKATLNMNYTQDLTQIFEDKNLDTLSFKVSKNNGAFDVIDANYSFKVTKVGKTTLTFLANDGKGDSVETYVVTFDCPTIPVQSINFSKEEVQIILGEEGEMYDIFAYQLLPANASYQSVMFSSSNENVLKIDNNGYLTNQIGRTIITITSKSNKLVFDTMVVEVIEGTPGTEEKLNIEGTLKGILLDSENQPCKNYIITLFSDPKTTLTDENGNFTFLNVPYSMHDLVINNENEVEVGRLQLVFNENGSATVVNEMSEQFEITNTENTETINLTLVLNESEKTVIVDSWTSIEKIDENEEVMEIDQNAKISDVEQTEEVAQVEKENQFGLWIAVIIAMLAIGTITSFLIYKKKKKK